MSEIRAGTLSDAAGTGPAVLTGQWAAKVSLNYNHDTPSITRGDNVSSVTDTGTGVFNVNYTNGFDAADYSWNGGAGDSVANSYTIYHNQGGASAAPATGTMGFITTASSPPVVADLNFGSVQITGDLA